MNLITLAAATDPTAAYKIISIVGYSLAAIFLVLGIALFFLFDIKSVYAYLTGRKKQQGISEMRKQQGEQEAKQKVTPSIKFGFTPAPKSTEAKHLNPNSMSKPPVQQVQAAPAPAVAETAPIGIEPAGEGTEVLSPAMGENDGTQLLSQQDTAPKNTAVDVARKVEYAKEAHVGTFELVKNEMVIHSDVIL
ncbi:MAG: hypothetical protein IKE65_01085 [Clostridia bacterium]|nr:hypothetical protein [Clostridia bacterium]